MSKLPTIIKPTKNLLVPAGKFYMTHQNVILPVAQVGLSIANGVIIFKNAAAITQIINDARTFVAQAHSKDEVNDIYKKTLKELTPKVLPIMILSVGQILVAVESKRAMDLKDKKIGELSDALSVANNAIVTYQAFQKEAEEKLGEKKVSEIKDAVAKEVVKNNPETKENSLVNTTPATANEVYHYFDAFGGRYFWSTLSPSAIKGRIQDLSIKFTKHEWSQYDENGASYVTVNDIYRLIDQNLVLTQRGDMFGWSDDMHPYRDDEIDDRFINVDIHGTEDPSSPDSLVWVIDIEGAPLFRTMSRW